MDFYKEILNFFKQKLSSVLIYFFPGILILELFFKKGFLNDNINNLYNFILYLVWGLSISLIFDFLLYISITNIVEKKAKRYFNKRNKNIPDDLYERMHPDESEFKEKMEDIESIINLIFYSIFILIVFALKILLIFLLNKYTVLPENYIINYIITNDILFSCIIFFILFLFRNLLQEFYLSIILSKEFKVLYDEIKEEYDA
jgi:hypothetical protein